MRQRGGPSKPRPLSVFILSFQTVDGRETFVLPAQLGDDLGVATLDDPPEPCGVFGRQRIARDRLLVDRQRLVRENRRAAATHHVVRELADDFFDRRIEVFAANPEIPEMFR